MKHTSASDPFDPQTLVLTACHGKHAYPTHHAAQIVADARRKRAKGKHTNHKHMKPSLAGMAPYKCGHCGQWHIGGRKK